MGGCSGRIGQPSKNENHLRENETLASACRDTLIPLNSIVRAIRVFLVSSAPGAIAFGELRKGLPEKSRSSTCASRSGRSSTRCAT